MKFAAVLAALIAAAPGVALAQAQPASPNVPSRGNAAIVQLLADGYDIKAAFVNSNISYVFLQKGTSAFMCKSVAGSACEKLN